MFYATPRLPRALLHILTVSNRTFVRDPANGGQSKPVDEPIASFWGIVMPVSDKDWKQLPEGSYEENTQKLYTDDPVDIQPGHIIRDTYDGQLYTVKQELNHNTIHPMRRFLVEGVVKK
ncbi:MAG: hypothetical protein J6N51_10700 [Selenomonas sp.]|nr:hypothetical protein [Selenomonas sp.]MBP3731019.1 hypothetical protein [Mailhella sp.]